jgi:ribonuclease HII
MHVANIEALRRAVALLDVPPQYVLTDGFPVDGLGRPGLAVWKGDRVAACIAAASVIAKVTRDRIMVALDRDHPAYDFKTHKGYVTDVHNAALAAHGPCSQHRLRFVNVRRAAGLEPLADALTEESAGEPAGEPAELPVPSAAASAEGELVVGTRVGASRSRGESA